MNQDRSRVKVALFKSTEFADVYRVAEEREAEMPWIKSSYVRVSMWVDVEFEPRSEDLTADLVASVDEEIKIETTKFAVKLANLKEKRQKFLALAAPVQEL